MSAEPAVPLEERPKVLVVDDSRVIRKAISKILGNEFQLIEAEDGESGWQKLVENENIQVVVADVEMPRLDGYALICRVRASEASRIRAVPMIIITGAHDEQTRERAFACGATDFITKPIDGVQLLARARAHARLDQTTRKLNEATKSLEEQSAIDPMTQLNSRRFFLQRGAQDIAFAKRHEQSLALVRLDIDNFRTIYKKYGDEASDQMLIWLANILRQIPRTEDTVARVGGGAFAIILPSSTCSDAKVVCERLRLTVVERPYDHEGERIALTVSLGIASFGKGRGETIEALLTEADRHLTLAKAEGGNRVGMGLEEEVAPPEESVIEKPDLEMALRMLTNGEGGQLLPYLPELLQRVLPLLEYCNKNMEMGLGFAVQSLKDKISNMK